jgi:hypothetical protein
MSVDPSQFPSDSVAKYRNKNNEVVVTHSIFVPKKLMPRDDVLDRYRKEIYLQDKCDKCDNKPFREPTNDTCAICPAFLGLYKLYTNPELEDNVDPNYWVLPQGDEVAVKRYLKKSDVDFNWTDLRASHYFKHPIKFIGKLHDGSIIDGQQTVNQVEAVSKFLKKGTGIIQVPPRGGKTVISTALYCHFGMRTIFIAHSKDLLNQIYETATGYSSPSYIKRGQSNETKRKRMTNIPLLQEKAGRDLILMPKNFGELLRYKKQHGDVPEILLMTYQSFIRDFSRLTRFVNKHYSVLAVDEIHRAGADKYFEFMSKTSARHRICLSATPTRKDSIDEVFTLVTGGVVSKVFAKNLQPNIIFQKLNTSPTTNVVSYQDMLGYLSKNPKRIAELVDHLFIDLNAGHSVILLPVDRIVNVEMLVEEINTRAKNLSQQKGQNWPKILARPFIDGVDRKKTFDWLDNEKDAPVGGGSKANNPRVLVAMRSMITEGIDVKRPSALYITIPMSANKSKGCPAFQQLSYRVCTPYKDKIQQPIVRVFVDNISASIGCAASLLYQEVLPNSDLAKAEEPKYKMSSENYGISKEAVKKFSSSSKEKTGWWR